MDFGYQFDALQARITSSQSELQRLRDNFAAWRELPDRIKQGVTIRQGEL